MNIRGWGLVAALFLALIFSIIDRMIISLLVEPMKADLGLSDTQISVLQGLAFMVIYSLASIPMGLLIDKVNRTRAIAAGVAVWSIMTMVSASARNFSTLFGARAGVGVGEAVLTPGAFSLIASTVPGRQQGLALGIFFFGACIGVTIALIAGGALVEHLQSLGGVELPLVGFLEPWRATFLIVGIPGLLLAALFWFIPEPSQKACAASAGGAGLVAFYRRNWMVLAPHHMAVGFCNMIVFASLMWVVTFLHRVHDWGIAESGMASGIANLFGGGVGLVLGGGLRDAVARRGEVLRLWLCMGLASGAAILGFCYPLEESPVVSAAIFSAVIACAMGSYGVGGAALQQMMPDRLRGSVAAVYGLVVYLFTALGPTGVALISDQVFPQSDGIRYALMVFTPGAAMMAVLCFGLSAWAYRTRGVVRPSGLPDM